MHSDCELPMGNLPTSYARRRKTTQSSGGFQYQRFIINIILNENVCHHPNDKDLRVMAVLRAFLFERPT
jgi:hypothetical protein